MSQAADISHMIQLVMYVPKDIMAKVKSRLQEILIQLNMAIKTRPPIMLSVKNISVCAVKIRNIPPIVARSVAIIMLNNIYPE